MNLLLSLSSLFVVVGIVAVVIAHQIGYLKGKQEVSHIMRGEPPDDELEKELRACGRGE